jgi:hypothetical protein
MKKAKSKIKSSGDPFPQSPLLVSKDANYEVMTNYIRNDYYPSADEIVVRHKASNTFWRAVYSVREDDSDFSVSATWTQVVPEQVITTRYKTIEETNETK